MGISPITPPTCRHPSSQTADPPGRDPALGLQEFEPLPSGDRASIVQRHAAELIRQYRQAAGLSQRQLADSAGVSIGVIRDLEQRRTARLHDESVQRLVDALDLDEQRASEFARAARGRTRLVSADPGVPGIRLGVLGPVTAWRDGARISLGGPRQRAVLGLLALTPDRLVHRATIIDALWGEAAPSTAVHLVQVYISRLRRSLAPAPLLASTGASYQLLLWGSQLDLADFDALASQAFQAHAAGDLTGACDGYASALGLWRAEPLADLDLLHAHPAVVSLRQRRVDLIISFTEAASAADQPDLVLPRLRELTAAEPLNEKAHARLMIALAGGGQQAAALTVFDEVRRRLGEQLGVRPGSELLAAHQRVLRQEVPDRPAPSGLKPTPARTPVPRQLPGRKLARC
ncbi:MAG TPA: BTAD domain-containing putative transcriptional regulator [Streptosporangiaceae bacterium]|jgi:DNA-binding SARP family transcriptional activator